MSSAILYLAIVAIWACVLVPRWLRRSHDAAPESEVLADETEAGDYAEGYDYGEYGSATQVGSATYSDSPAYADSPAYSDSSGWSDSSARPESGARSDAPARPDFAAPADSGARPGVARPSRYGPARPPAPGSGRARVVQARRRMLTMLVALAATAMTFVVTGLTSWWTAVPPVGMLLAYVLLLREAARADAEAVRRAEAYARYARAQAAREAYQRAREAHAQARAARLRQPAAEVIDISNRAAEAADQPYDQYTDATDRAVGD